MKINIYHVQPSVTTQQNTAMRPHKYALHQSASLEMAEKQSMRKEMRQNKGKGIYGSISPGREFFEKFEKFIQIFQKNLKFVFNTVQVIIYPTYFS